jgi:YesN/AraC family two-component response regulator
MKVLIVDDERPARDRLQQILDDEPDYEVVGQAGNGHEAMEMAAELHPDIVLGCLASRPLAISTPWKHRPP